MSEVSIIKEFCKVASNDDCTVRVIDINAKANSGRYELQKIQSIVSEDFEGSLPIAFNAVITSDEQDNVFGVEFSVKEAKVPASYKKVNKFN